MPSGWTDVVGNFVSLTEEYNSPLIFRTFSGISLLAGALERRVWTVIRGDQPTYPNMYTLLVGEPGSGKQVIDVTERLWRETLNCSGPAFHVASTSLTKAALMDSLNDAKLDHLVPGTDPGSFTYASLLIAAEEMGALLSNYDTDFLEVLNKMYNNPAVYSERRRTGSVKTLDIQNPQFNILGAEQPGRLATIYPEAFWSAGFASRTIMVYAEPPPPSGLFSGSSTVSLKEQILRQLADVATLYGPMKWHPDAAVAFNSWHIDPAKQAPTHSKLVPYVARRTQHAAKLIMVAAVSRTGELKIDPCDVIQGITWLRDAEATMPSIFMAMKSGSDKQTIEVLYEFVYRAWSKSQRQPVPSGLLYRFLSDRAPVERIPRIIETAERGGVIERVGGSDSYIPKSTLEHKLQ